MIALVLASSLAQAPPAEPAVVRTTIDSILQSSEFTPKNTGLERAIAWIVDALADLLPDGGVSRDTLEMLAATLVYVVLGALVVLLGWVIVRAWRRREKRSIAVPDPAVVRARRVEELRQRARAANTRGEHVLALRLEFTALVVGLGERGDLEYRDAFTNRELLERGRPGREAEALLRPIVPELDRRSFGGESATSEDFAHLSALCDRLLAGARP